MPKDVKKRSNGRWGAVVRRNGIYLGAKVLDTRKEADAWVQNLLAQHTDGVDLRRAKRTVASYIEEFHEDREKYSNVTAGTRQTDRHMFMRVSPWFLELPVGKVETRHIEKVLFDDARAHPERTHESIKRCRTTLSAFFRYLVKMKVITRNPAIGAEVPAGRLTEEVIPWMGSEIYERYAVWSRLDPEMADVALVIYLLALRWGEAKALTVGDVRRKNFEEVYVWRSKSEFAEIKETKQGKARWVPVSDVIRPILEEFAEGRGDQEFLFEGLTRMKFKYRLNWKETSQGKTIHSLRHGGITTWIEAGVLVSIAMKWSGHARSSTLERYTHLVGSRVNQGAIAQVNAFNQGQILHR